MNTSIVFILALIPALTFGTLVVWDPVYSLKNVYYQCSPLPTSNGITHVFCVKNSNPYVITYRALDSNGNWTKEKIIGNKYWKFNSATFLSVQASEDGKHLLVACIGRIYDQDSSDSPYKFSKILFIESYNGGKNWERPMELNSDFLNANMNLEKYDIRPRLIFERETGRVCIAYYSAKTLVLIFREPGKKTFEPEIYIEGKDHIYLLAMEYTYNRNTASRRYHIFWIPENPLLHTNLYYTYSDDGGKEWSEDLKLVSGVQVDLDASIAVDTKVSEGGLYVQIYQRNDIRVLSSKDHGNTWELPIRVGTDFNNYDSLALCGLRNRGVLLSFNLKLNTGVGFFRYMRTDEHDFKNLKYPIQTLRKADFGYTRLKCTSMSDGRYSLVILIKNYHTHQVMVLHGILKDP